ncbi:zn 2cys6 transcription factor protein [Rutstroemia sp. NJR-2017a BVV2]|nr:zn 2cys6 transcription factor protein [Rutstroemia sp. NJR-2017a BVV2]
MVPLILQHFERGPKLNDSSNRYQHTCKTCGEKFPKGRIDSLTAHLVKKCPAISLRDRQRALLELNNLPDVADRTRNAGPLQPVPNVGLSGANRNWTALETLAEVSRRMDLSEKRDDKPDSGSPAEDRTFEPLRSDNLELQEQYTLDNPPMSYESRAQREKKIRDSVLTFFTASSQKSQPKEANAGSMYLNALSASRATSPNLAMAATAAAAARFIPSMVDPQLLSEDADAQEKLTEARLTRELADATMAEMYNSGSVDQPNNWSMQDSDTQAAQNATQVAQMAQLTQLYTDAHASEQQSTEIAETAVSGPVPGPGAYQRLAMNPAMTTEFSAEYGNGQKANKPKVRGRFSDTRRKEVQEVRKRGACIRCRMLKKPCSGETPCNTCKSVDNARLWKTPCVRTRLTDEMEMYSANLYTVLAHHDVSMIKASVNFRSSSNQIEASHLPATGIVVEFNCLEAVNVPIEGQIDPGLNNNFNSSYRILDTDNDDITAKLETYIKRMITVFIDNEPSSFMRTTLRTALNLSIEKQDTLLTRALEFWAMVHIHVDTEVSWSLNEKICSGEQAGQTRTIPPTSESSWSTMVAQLNAAAEKKAGMMCRNILNELERRLLQHNKASSFEVFLISLLVLNCIEKSTWAFKSWEQDLFKSRWPLDKNPVWFGSQGDKLTDLLQMLLNTRSVPPKSYADSYVDGILVVDVKVEGDKRDTRAHDFFNEIQLRRSYVLDKQLNPVFDPANSRCFELRYSSRLLYSGS